MPSPRPSGILLIGAGRFGRNHARVLRECGRLAAVVDPDPLARGAAARDNSVLAAASIDELPRSVLESAAAAVIATPAETHCAVGLDCLRRDLDVLVEKPLALSVADARLLAEEAERRGRRLLVGHQLLHHPAVRALAALIAADELGEIRYVYSNRLNLGRVRREENILWSFAPHDVAVMMHLLGRAPTRVRADGGTWLQPGVVDVTVTHLEFTGGVRGHVFVSWLHPEKVQRFVVVGARKMAVFDDRRSDARLLIHDVGIDAGQDGELAARRGAATAVELEDTEPLAAQCAHFIDCIDGTAEPAADASHGIRVLEVLEAAERSLAADGNWQSVSAPF